MKILTGCVLSISMVISMPAFACDQQQAVDMMVKLSTALGEMAGAAKTEEDSLKVTAANARVNEAGEALAAGKPDQACEIYQSIAAEHGISLD